MILKFRNKLRVLANEEPKDLVYAHRRQKMDSADWREYSTKCPTTVSFIFSHSTSFSFVTFPQSSAIIHWGTSTGYLEGRWGFESMYCCLIAF